MPFAAGFGGNAALVAGVMKPGTIATLPQIVECGAANLLHNAKLVWGEGFF
jgi:hypothetical protein